MLEAIRTVLGLSPSHAAVIAGMYFLMGLIEYLAPAEHGQRWAGRGRNVLYTFLYLGIGTLILRNLPQVHDGLESHDHHYPMAYAILYILVGDFFYYWYHRLEHAWALLWRVHELHHSDAELNVTTSLRTHWIEKPVQYYVVSIPTLYILEADTAAFYWWIIIGQSWEMFTHANIKFFVHPIASVLCNPNIHRVHHSKLDEHRHCNFAQYFTVLDMLFGTYVAPKCEVIPPTGTATLASDYSVLMNMVRPFLPRKPLWRTRRVGL